MIRTARVLIVALACCFALAAHAAAGGPTPPGPLPGMPHGGPAEIASDAVALLQDIDLHEEPVTGGAQRMALPPGATAPEPGRPTTDSGVRQDLEEWRVDNGTPALVTRSTSTGLEHGLANRFDPADFWDTERIPPRPLRIHRIHFFVHPDEPTGPLEWHIWEDNGGHKADQSRDIMEPLVVTGGPEENVIDLAALGREVVIDPPRMFEVGVANRESADASPDIMLDSGLPFVGSTGDFHASFKSEDDYCGLQWVIVAADLGDGAGPRSPAWMIWLEVEWLDPPTELYFDEAEAGDFSGASRIAWADFDADGYEDILASGSHLHRNLGDGTFANVTEEAGIYDTGSGAIWGDYDNDGDPDFYQYTSNCVPCGHDDNYDDLWRNEGDGTFTNVRDVDFSGDSAAPVPRDPLPTEGATWADFNGDGYLDLYAANHVNWDTGACYDDYLWLNSGPPDYTFRDVSEESGIRAARLCGRGVNAADFDADGDIDIFVSNYRLNPDLLWVNASVSAAGVPQLVNEARARGVEGRLSQIDSSIAYGHTIGSVWGDIDRDSNLDLVSARLAHSAWRCFSDVTGVYFSEGPEEDYTFENRRYEAGVEYNEVHSDPSLADFDNDGHLDLHITHVYDGWRSSTYRNVGESPSRFENVTHVSGIWPRRGWGSGWSDFDRDGDIDLAARGLFVNRAAADEPHHWLQVEVQGCGPSNRDAIGANVWLDLGEHSDWRQVVAARGTGSQDSRVQHFGLGSETTVDQVRVEFPSGQTKSMADVAADQRLRVVELGAVIRTSPRQPWAGRPFDLIADTCGEERQVNWDLDADGSFDDGDEPVVPLTFGEVGRYPVAVKVSDGEAQVVMSQTLEVELYIPTPTPTRTPIPWPTPGPSPTVDRTDFVSIYLPYSANGWPPLPAGAPKLDPIRDPDGDGQYTVSWSSVDRAVLYALEEDERRTFDEPEEAYKGGKTSVLLDGRTGDQYCYRVRALNTYGSGPWSEVRCLNEPTATPLPTRKPTAEPTPTGQRAEPSPSVGPTDLTPAPPTTETPLATAEPPAHS